jgi:hypothetical protein
MPRPTPQSFARQLCLQAIMWGLFVAAFAGATALSHTRGLGLRIAALDPPAQFGWIKIAVPTGWAVEVDRAEVRLGAIESKHNGIQRVLIVSQEQLNGPPDAAYLLRQLKREVALTRIEFAGLHIAGQMAEVTIRDEQTGAPTQEYFAVGVLPNNVVVKVELRGVPGFGPIDSNNFRQIVDALQPGADLSPHRMPPGATGPLEPVADWRIRT